jgi:hypothetical protein
MSGFNKSDNSIANGIPARHISPETGSSGNATMTNKGGTSEGTNEAFDSDPAPAAGMDAPIYTGSDVDESRSFASGRSGLHRADDSGPLDADEESPAQQIADGGDRIRHIDDDDDDFNDSKGG